MDTELIFCIRLDIQPRERHRNETDELCSEKRKKTLQFVSQDGCISIKSGKGDYSLHVIRWNILRNCASFAE